MERLAYLSTVEQVEKPSKEGEQLVLVTQNRCWWRGTGIPLQSIRTGDMVCVEGDNEDSLGITAVFRDGIKIWPPNKWGDQHMRLFETLEKDPRFDISKVTY